MKKIFFLLGVLLSLQIKTLQAAKLEDFFDKKEIKKKAAEIIASQDINFGLDLAKLSPIDGLEFKSKYQYDVEASNVANMYTRIDKWDVNTGINIGEVLKDLVDIPFSFSIGRNSSFYFVRQFPKQWAALKAIPYTPQKLPLTANLALKNLNVGDFVSIPANLNVAVSAQASTSMVSPVVLSANASVFYVLSGEFIIQVYKLDETHVRLKLITKRGTSVGGSAGAGISFKVFGIKIIDSQIDHQFDRDLAQLGYSFNPGSQFILDYVFNLADPDARTAYNQIVSTTFKFKDFVVADMVNAKDLRDRLISSYEKAEFLFEADKHLDVKARRVQRIFEGFNSYKGHTRHLKFALLVTSYKKDNTFTDAKITFVDKKENNLEFYYPTFTKYIKDSFGRWGLDIQEEISYNHFGLIPKFNLEDSTLRNPDLGVTFERKDDLFSTAEQQIVKRFMVNQIPAPLAKNIDFSEWSDGSKKRASRIFFQLVIKAQGFPYLRDIPEDVLEKKLLTYAKEKGNIFYEDEDTDNSLLDKFNNFFFFNKHLKKERLKLLASSLSKTLKIENSEVMLKKLVGLNEYGVFDKLGVGFLISLLPQDKIKDLAYLKLEMVAKGVKPINTEVGALNYRVLYNELTQIQSRLTNRGYDLSLSEEDRQMGDIEIEPLPIN